MEGLELQRVAAEVRVQAVDGSDDALPDLPQGALKTVRTAVRVTLVQKVPKKSNIMTVCMAELLL